MKAAELRSMTEDQLGAMLGLSQARIARIEGRPDAISVAQLLHVLSTLGARLVLSTADASAAPPLPAPGKRPRRPANRGDW